MEPQDTLPADANNPIRPVLVWALCVFVPPGLYLLLQPIATKVVDAWKNGLAGGIIAVGCVVLATKLWMALRNGMSPLYKKPLRTSILLHCVVVFFAALVLDGGFTLYACILACLFYWALVGVVLTRRPLAPSSGDLIIVRSGYLLLALSTTFVFWILFALRGY